MLCDIVSCQYHWVQLQTLAKMTSLPGPSCGQTKSNVADCFHTDLCGDRSMKAATTAQVIVRDIGQLLRGESFIFLYINTLFSHTERVALRKYGLPNHCWNGVITWFTIWPVLPLCIQTLATKCSSMDQMLITVNPIYTQHTINNDKMRLWALAHCSFVTCIATQGCQVM